MTEREQQLEVERDEYSRAMMAEEARANKAERRNQQLEALLRASENLFRRFLRHGLLRAEIETLLLDLAALAKPAPNAAPQEAEGGRAAILPAVTQEAPAVAAPQESSEAVRLARETIVLGDEEGNTLLGECLRGTTAYTLAREVLRLHERGKDHS